MSHHAPISVAATAALLLTHIPLISGAGGAPEQFRISLGGSSTSPAMRVMFTTPNSTILTQCSYGTSASTLNITATGTSVNYLPNYGYHHTVLLSSLNFSTSYFYSCGDGSSSPNTSSTFTFSTPPSPTDPLIDNLTFSTAIFGDWGYLDSVQRPVLLPVGGIQKNFSATLVRELLESLKEFNQISMVWNVGDIAYSDDAFTHDSEVLHFGYEEVYSGWMNWIQNLSASLPYMVAAGNHESECHSPFCVLNLQDYGLHLNNFTAYNARFAMPSLESGGVLNMWFSWRWGPVHFISINTETDFDGAPENGAGDSGFSFLPAGYFAPNGTYMKWLQEDLEAASKDTSVKWIIAGGHRPFEDFNSAPVAALFQQYGVDMYFAGHAHSYSRFNSSVYGDNAVHIIVGGAGNDEMPYPTDQVNVDKKEDMDEDKLYPSAVEACNAWCLDPDVRKSFVHHRVKKAPTTDVGKEEEKRGGIVQKNSASESSAASNMMMTMEMLSPITKGSSADDNMMIMIDAAEDPCRYCASGPMYFSDNMAIGVLKATTHKLEWSLLRGPDGLVLDSVVLTK